MSIISYWKENFWKKASYVDYVLVKFSCIAFGVMLVALFPSLIDIDVWWIALVVLLLAIKPLHTLLKR